MIKAIIGLGNPGQAYYKTRHSIGFQVVDAIATKLGASWKEQKFFLVAQGSVEKHKILLIKPLTFMNNSGAVIPFLLKQGVKPEEILVVHDELELPFGTVKIRQGGSHRGHNGLRSIIAACGPSIARLRCGIGRPGSREEIAAYVLAPFEQESVLVEQMITQAADLALDAVVYQQ